MWWQSGVASALFYTYARVITDDAPRLAPLFLSLSSFLFLLFFKFPLFYFSLSFIRVRERGCITPREERGIINEVIARAIGQMYIYMTIRSSSSYICISFSFRSFSSRERERLRVNNDRLFHES